MSERKRSRDFGKRQKIRAILVSAKKSRMKKCRLDTRKITAGVESQLLRPDIRMMDWYSISRCQATTAHKISSVEDGITRKILPLFQPPPPMQTLVLPIGKEMRKYFFKKKKRKISQFFSRHPLCECWKHLVISQCSFSSCINCAIAVVLGRFFPGLSLLSIIISFIRGGNCRLMPGGEVVFCLAISLPLGSF